MVIQRTVVGSKRVELQNKPVILPTSAVEGLTPGDLQKVTNPALAFTVLSWDNDVLVTITPAGAYQGAFAQYKTRVKQYLDIDVRDQAIIGA